MKLTHVKNVFLANPHNFEEDKALERAGFEWHPGPHVPWHDRFSCDACQVLAPIGFFTKDANTALLFINFADEKTADVLMPENEKAMKISTVDLDCAPANAAQTDEKTTEVSMAENEETAEVSMAENEKAVEISMPENEVAVETLMPENEEDYYISIAMPSIR